MKSKQRDLAQVRKEHGGNLVFRHYDVPVSNGGIGHICVAILRPPKNATKFEFKAAVTFGSPLDQDNQRKAKNIAAGRLFSERPGRNAFFTLEKADLNVAYSVALEIFCNPRMMVLKNRRKVASVPDWILPLLESGYPVVEIKDRKTVHFAKLAA